jgi:sugar phosphate isomerase/epimerase
MRISLSTGTFYHRRVSYSLRLARDLGLDGVELVLGWDYMLTGVTAIERAARRVSAPVLSVHPPLLPLPGWPRNVRVRLERLAAATRDLGAGILVLHTPFLRGEDSPRAQMYTRLLEMTQRLAGPDVCICLENNEYQKRSLRYLLDDLGTLARFAQERGCGVTFDTCHAGANGDDLLRCYEIVRPVLRNVHLSDLVWRDGVSRTHVLPGAGELPLQPFLRALARDGYDGLLTLEIHPAQVGLFGHTCHRRLLRGALGFVREALAAETATPTLQSGEAIA